MANYLVLGPNATSWRLGLNEDPEDVQNRLRSVTGVVEVTVVPQDQLEETTLVLRPGLVPWSAVVSRPDPTVTAW